MKRALLLMPSILGCSLLVGCDPPPQMAPEQTKPSKVDCVRGVHEGVTIVVCDLTDKPRAFESFLRGQIVPDRERKLRLRSAVNFVSASAAAGELGQDSTRDGSYIRPYVDAQMVHDMPGWELFDSKNRLAMLLVGVNHRTGVIVTEFPTTSAKRVKALVALLDHAGTIEDVSRDIKGRSTFTLDATTL